MKISEKIKNFLKWVLVVGSVLILGLLSTMYKNISSPLPSPQVRPADLEIVPGSRLKIGGVILKVELARTATEQEQGLSGRSGLKEDEGMLFVFDQPDKYSFWMKDMNFAIDIIWISEELRVVYIEKNARPESYPKTYSPDGPSKYVLEVQAKFSEKHNIQVGDKVEFLP